MSEEIEINIKAMCAGLGMLINVDLGSISINYTFSEGKQAHARVCLGGHEITMAAPEISRFKDAVCQLRAVHPDKDSIHWPTF